MGHWPGNEIFPTPDVIAPDIGIPVSGFLRSSLMNMDEEKRSAFAKRLKDLALHMYDAMSQGQHNTIFVTQEMADDVLAAAIFVNLSKSDKDLE